MAHEASNETPAHAARGRALRELVARLAATHGGRPGRRALSGLIRHAAATRLERRLNAGVVVIADVHEEQELLRRLVTLAERGDPLTAEAFETIQRLIAEKVAPPLPTSLAQLRRLPQLRLPIQDTPRAPGLFVEGS